MPVIIRLAISIVYLTLLVTSIEIVLDEIPPRLFPNSYADPHAHFQEWLSNVIQMFVFFVAIAISIILFVWTIAPMLDDLCARL